VRCKAALQLQYGFLKPLNQSSSKSDRKISFGLYTRFIASKLSRSPRGPYPLIITFSMTQASHDCVRAGLASDDALDAQILVVGEKLKEVEQVIETIKTDADAVAHGFETRLEALRYLRKKELSMRNEKVELLRNKNIILEQSGTAMLVPNNHSHACCAVQRFV
jgi:hypothetical protein